MWIKALSFSHLRFGAIGSLIITRRHQLQLSRYINTRKNRREMFFNSFRLKEVRFLCTNLQDPEESVGSFCFSFIVEQIERTKGGN